MHYYRYYSLLKKSPYWKKEEIESYQLAELKKLVGHAYENVPYYTRLFKENNLKPDDFKSLRDLRKLPFLTKDIIRKNIDDLKATNYPPDRFEYVTTGGTSGTPMEFYYEKGVSRSIEWAFMKTQWDRVGYRFTDKCVFLRGTVIEPKNDIYWKKSFFGRWLMMSSSYLTEKNLPKYIDEIRTFNPKYIQAFPSAITILAKHMKKNNVCRFKSLKAILCGSENMYPGQRELLEEVFKCRVFSWYGHSERVVLAGECKNSAYYHVFPEYGIFELVDNAGNNLTSDGDSGFIVGTGLTNYAMPLIRYKTDDTGTLSVDPCPCGRHYQLLKKVNGRWAQEFIFGKSDRRIPLAALNTHSDIYDNVERFQFHQVRAGELILKIVKTDGYTQKDTIGIASELKQKLGNDIALEIRFVDDIPRTSIGKYKFLVQEIPARMEGNQEKNQHRHER